MNKIPLCARCAFSLNAENNPKIIVMSINGTRNIARCSDCNARIGHSGSLNYLIGVYHERRHDEHEEPRKDAGLGERFKIYRKSRYNGDTLSCFIMAIKKGYGERTIRDYFNELVDDKDIEMYDKKKLIEELIEIAKPSITSETSQGIKK